MDNRRSHRAKFIVLLLLLTTILYAQGPSFRTPRLLTEHYLKHGPEFGHITKLEYLRLAQQLRDAPVGGPILESRRPDGEFSRFDRRHGYFGAYNPDHTIRTFFIPNDGERYFDRQSRRPRP
jgi:pyocin large subunit-like protein